MKNKEAILELKKAGVRNHQIAAVLGVSKQYVSRISRTEGLTKKKNKRFIRNGMLTISVASEFLKVPKTTLRRWSDDGTFPAFRENGGRARMYMLSDLLSFVRNNQADTLVEHRRRRI